MAPASGVPCGATAETIPYAIAMRPGQGTGRNVWLYAWVLEGHNQYVMYMRTAANRGPLCTGRENKMGKQKKVEKR